jgi:hypothetical protein
MLRRLGCIYEFSYFSSCHSEWLLPRWLWWLICDLDVQPMSAYTTRRLRFMMRWPEYETSFATVIGKTPFCQALMSLHRRPMPSAAPPLRIIDRRARHFLILVFGYAHRS